MEIKTIKVGVDNCYLIKDNGLILVDWWTAWACKYFASWLKKLNIDPKEIKALIITHCHWDHIGCVKTIQNLTKAKIIVHKNEKEILEQWKSSMPPWITFWWKFLGPLLNKRWKNFEIEKCKADIVVDKEETSLKEFGINGKIIFTPGHSKGSLSVVLDSWEAFVGDLAMNWLPLSLTPSLPIFGEDSSMIIKSWQKLIDLGVKQVYPAHGKAFPINKIKKIIYKKSK